MERNRLLLQLGTTTYFVFLLLAVRPTSAQAQSDPPPPPAAPTSYHDSFEEGYLFFDDAVGVLHVRQSGSTAETDYAPGISASDGGFYARLLVQAALQAGGGINGSQSGRCNPGNPMADNGF